MQVGNETNPTSDTNEIDKRSRYEKCQLFVYKFLESPKSKLAICYHMTNLLFILGSICISVLSTMDTFNRDDDFQAFTFLYEVIILVWFTVEYLFRLWSCTVVKRFRGCYGRIRFLKTFYMCVDAFIIVSTFVTSVMHVEKSYFTILRATRFLQVFRILRVDRQKGDLGMMVKVVYTHHREMITCYFVGFIILFAGAYILFIIEHGCELEGVMINDMAKGLYWGLITVTSVGYGDFSPVTWGGKMFTGVFALIGCAFFALPAGILGSGFAIQVAKQKTQRNMFKIKTPAAILIQTTWRNFATNRNKVQFQGTWNRLLPQWPHWPSYYEILPGIKAIESFEISDLMTRFGGTKPDEVKANSLISKKKRIYKKALRPASRRPTVNKELTKVYSERQAKYKPCIQFILRIKYWVVLHKFKTQRRPFVEMTDIHDKNTQWHYETVSVLREMKDQSKNLKQELKYMKEALYRKVERGDEGWPKIARKRSLDKDIYINGEDDVVKTNNEPSNDESKKYEDSLELTFLDNGSLRTTRI